MSSVYSEYFNVTITGNMVTRHGIHYVEVGRLAETYPQMTVVRGEKDDVAGYSFDVTAPMDENDRRTYAALIHRMNSENKLGQKRNPDDKPDGPPPAGGTPGAAKQELFEHVQAMAA